MFLQILSGGAKPRRSLFLKDAVFEESHVVGASFADSVDGDGFPGFDEVCDLLEDGFWRAVDECGADVETEEDDDVPLVHKAAGGFSGDEDFVADEGFAERRVVHVADVLAELFGCGLVSVARTFRTCLFRRGDD